MAFTRNFLKSAGLTDEQISAVIEAHTEVTDALKHERDDWKGKAESIGALTKERDELKDKLAKTPDAAKVQAEFDNYKKQVESEKLSAAKTAAVKKALRAAGVQREAFETLLLGKVDLDKVTLDGDGVKDPDALIKPLKESFADCFATTSTQGTPPSNPPSGGKSAKTKEEILNIKDAGARQKAMIENHELFGF